MPIRRKSIASANLKRSRLLAAIPAIWLSLLVGLNTVWAQPELPEFINGVDASFIDHYERNGVVFTDDGSPVDPLEIFKANGINTIRLRLWHTPAPENDYAGLDRTLEMAKRVKDAGLDLFLDFHYSDWWADPGKQNKPAAWAGAPFFILKDSIKAYTSQVIGRLSAQGTLPEIVQIGNEIIQGMLWNDGRVGGSFDTPAQWQKLAELIQAADSGIVAGLSESDLKPAVMIHIDRGGDPRGTEWFFDNLSARGVNYDLIGLSYYPFWHGRMSVLERTLRIAAIRYKKPIVVAETAYPWTLTDFDSQPNFVWAGTEWEPGYPISVDGQFSFLRDVKKLVKATPQGFGRGLVWWEPGHIAAPGLRSAWDNLTLFDNNADALESMAAFNDSLPVAIDPVEIPMSSNTGMLETYPNPFSVGTTVRYSIDEPDDVNITVFDLTGREVASLATGRIETSGIHEAHLDASRLSPGTYVISLRTQRTGQVRHVMVHLN